nr:probable signal peptidase complex subunit 2 [Ipomoea batatas]
MPADSGRTDAGMTVSPAAYYARPITAYYARPISAYYARPINAYYARPITVLTASAYNSLRGMPENRPMPPTIPAANVDEAAPTIPAANEARPSKISIKVEHMGDIVMVHLARPLLKELKSAVRSRFRHLKTRGMVLKFTYKDQGGDTIDKKGDAAASANKKNPKKANLLDHGSIKHLLDESVSEIVTSKGYTEDVRLSNIRLLLGIVIITIALFAQFYNKKFPDNRNFLLGCIVLYPFLNLLSQF